jgi:metal-responsive CopG/Arc/MetJ family transcriptional regulator
MTGEEDFEVWTIRLKKNLAKIVDDTVAHGTDSTRSEFVRQALREKLERMGVKLQIAD